MKINSGKKIDEIKVVISKRIIELFSAGLYSSPNKAFEELVCNSYDAFADKVGVYVPSDLTVPDAMIWVCDNGHSMNQNELKDLWKVGDSNKNRQREAPSHRLPIGRFGIGKLATYILANNLTYLCKKDGRYLATKMDYTLINNDGDLKLDEIELTEDQAKQLIDPIVHQKGIFLSPFQFFGQKSERTWTLSILSNLKPKSTEIKEGRLKWVLKTALPINPSFNLYFNGSVLESSKIKTPIMKTWIIGKDDETASKMSECDTVSEGNRSFLNFPNLKRVYGKIELYEDSLLDGKSSELGRSHGIFLMVRGRLINLDDPLLGMDAFSHGAFNKSRIIVHADELDNNIASTREAIKESLPYSQLKNYLKKKFNNEVRKYYFENEMNKERENTLSYRLLQTPNSISKTPILNFIRRYFKGEVTNPWLIEIPNVTEGEQKDFIFEMEENLETESIISGEPLWEYMAPDAPIAKYDIPKKILRINLMHPFIANYSDQIRTKLPIEFIATTEVLTEAHMYEIGLDEGDIQDIMRRRDRVIRELVFSDRLSAPVVVELIKSALADPTGLEESIYKAFLTLGFETNKIGGNGTPDGQAHAILGYSESDRNENYSLTYDAKSTGKTKIKSETAKLATINRHKTTYNANFALVVAVDFEGSDDPSSSISLEATQQKITVMKAKDLMRLVLLAVPKQIGLKKLRELFETCYTPLEVSAWVDSIEESNVERGPINELLQVIYTLQKNDSEPPELASVRYKLNQDIGGNYSKNDLKDLIQSLKILVPGFINLENERVNLNQNPRLIKEALGLATNSIPLDFQNLYIEALQIK